MQSHVKNALKRRGRAIHLAFVRKWFSFSRTDLLDGLRAVGIAAGDCLLVHSSFDRFASYKGSGIEVNDTIRESVGIGGTVLMPTLPFSGSAVDYVRSVSRFDVRRTPSQMGLLTELFRRQQGVLRSVHP